MAIVKTLPEIMLQRACLEPESVACRFFKGAALVPETLSFSALYEQAAGLALQLQASNLASQRVLIVCKSQKNFVIAFYGCLLAGSVAIPASPPKRQLLQSRLQLIIKDGAARAIIFDTDVMLDELTASDGGPLRVDMREDPGANASASQIASWTPAIPAESTPAFLQYKISSCSQATAVL
jgi:acyl-CoA synthetase (AMP-forming)/AMP-acid ligase II